MPWERFRVQTFLNRRKVFALMHKSVIKFCVIRFSLPSCSCDVVSYCNSNGRCRNSICVLPCLYHYCALFLLESWILLETCWQALTNNDQLKLSVGQRYIPSCNSNILGSMQPLWSHYLTEVWMKYKYWGCPIDPQWRFSRHEDRSLPFNI